MASRSLSISHPPTLPPSLPPSHPPSHPPSLPLHRLSQTVEKRVIILSIHQPRYSIFSLFTSLTLLSQGHLVYHGTPQQVLPYFHSLGQIHVHIPQIIHRLIVDLGKAKEKVEEFKSGIVTGKPASTELQLPDKNHFPHTSRVHDSLHNTTGCV